MLAKGLVNGLLSVEVQCHFHRRFEKTHLILHLALACLPARYGGTSGSPSHQLPGQRGSSGFNNAIALYFECYARAGHNFAKRPKGRKYSPNRLRTASAQWHSKVEIGNPPTQVAQ